MLVFVLVFCSVLVLVLFCVDCLSRSSCSGRCLCLVFVGVRSVCS